MSTRSTPRPGVDNLAYRSQGQLADGFTAILAGCQALLRPGGHVVVTAGPYRHHAVQGLMFACSLLYRLDEEAASLEADA